MRITHKVDYGVRALVRLAKVDGNDPIKRELLAEAESIPPAFLDDILRSLRNGGLVRSQRGAEGGWRLARPAKEISVADVIRALEGPLAAVRGIRPHDLRDEGVDEAQVTLWVAVRSALRSVLERVTLADLASGELPAEVLALTKDPDAWISH